MKERIPSSLIRTDEAEFRSAITSAYISLEPALETLLQNNDFPEAVNKRLREIAILKDEELRELAKGAERAYKHALSATSYIPTPEEQKKLIRSQISREIFNRMANYLNAEKSLDGDKQTGAIRYSFARNNFISAAIRLLINNPT